MALGDGAAHGLLVRAEAAVAEAIAKESQEVHNGYQREPGQFCAGSGSDNRLPA